MLPVRRLLLTNANRGEGGVKGMLTLAGDGSRPEIFLHEITTLCLKDLRKHKTGVQFHVLLTPTTNHF